MSRKLMLSSVLSVVLMAVVPQLAIPDVAAAQTAAQVEAGKPLFDANGRRVGTIYGVEGAERVSLLINGRMVFVPVATISEADGKLTTSLIYRDIVRAR